MLLHYYNYYTVRVVQNQVSISNHNMISLYMNQIDKGLDTVEQYLLGLASSNFDVSNLGAPSSEDGTCTGVGENRRGRRIPLKNPNSAYGSGRILDLPGETVRMAIAVIGVIPVLAAYPFFQRYFIKGIAVGAVKG